MTLPSFIGVGTAQWIASNNTPIPSMSPVNGNIGDLLLLILDRNDSTAAPAVTNWTNIAAATGVNSTVQSSAAYWKIATSATGTSDATGTVTFGTSTIVRGGVVLRFRDTSAVAPVHGTPTLANVASTATTVNATNFSTTVNNCIAVFVASMIGARSTTNTTTNWTAGTGVTAFASQQTSLGNDETIGYGSKTFAALGSLLTPGITWTTNTTTGTGQGILIALREVFAPNAAATTAATNVARVTLDANWTAPATDSTHDAATGYTLDVDTRSDFGAASTGGNTVNALAVGNVLTRTVTGLSGGVTYYYRVRATNNNATAAANSNTTNATTVANPATPSDAYGSAVYNTTGLVAYWRLDETSGTLVLDSKGTYDGTSHNVTLSTAGLLTGTADTAYGFNGSTSYVSVPFASALNPSVFSVEVWVHITSNPANDQHAIDSGGTWYLAWSPNPGVGMVVEIGASNTSDPTMETPPQTQAHHVVATYDGTDGRIYTDGVVAPKTTLSYTPPSSGTLFIGSANNGTDFINGTLDEIAIYNVALDQATISDHYNKGIGYFAEISGMPDGHRGQVQMHQLLAQ